MLKPLIRSTVPFIKASARKVASRQVNTALVSSRVCTCGTYQMSNIHFVFSSLHLSLLVLQPPLLALLHQSLFGQEHTLQMYLRFVLYIFPVFSFHNHLPFPFSIKLRIKKSSPAMKKFMNLRLKQSVY